MADLRFQTPRPRSGFLYLVVIALVLTSAYIIFNPSDKATAPVDLSTFVEQVKKGEITKIKIRGNKLIGTRADGINVEAVKEPGDTMRELLSSVDEARLATIQQEVIDTESENFWTNLFFSILPFLLIVGFFIFMMRHAQNTNNQALSFGKSMAKLYEKGKQNTTFADVAGAEDSKEELKEIVDFLRTPAKYTAMGAKIPKGVLLMGPPGTGKTLLARAVAGEANVPFFSMVGSEFVEMFVGVGASRVRDLFRKAKRNAPCIIFIDEIDAVGRHRGAGLGGGHDEREQTLNQILAEMDGFEKDTQVIVMAATNRPDVLDPALLRPGRFDRRVVVDMPDLKAREEILKVHSKGKPLTKQVKLSKIAKQTAGFSGADLENLMNEAALLAARENKKEIDHDDVEKSIEKVALGPEKKSRVLSKKEKEITAHHETGHAVCAQMLPNCDPVHKVSIVSRGMALGVTWYIPDEEQYLRSKAKFKDELCAMMGGYMAEKIIFGPEAITTGSSNDLEKATNLARRMVMEYGMSDLGPVIFGDQQREIFLGRDFGHIRNFSEEIAARIDKEIQKIIKEAEEHTETIIRENLPLIRHIAEKLIQKETLSGDEFRKFFPLEFRKKTPKKTSRKKIAQKQGQQV